MKRAWMVFSVGCVAFGSAYGAPATQPAALVAPAAPVVAVPLTAPADLPALQGRPDESPSTQPALGPKFSSPSAGIEFRPPAGCKMIHRAGSADTIAEFANDEKKITFRVTKTSLTKPLKLSVPADTPGPTINGEKDKGLLEMTSSQLLLRMPNSKVLRQDVMPLAGHDAGILALRVTAGVQHQLVQQAIVQANEQLYYNLIYTTPGQAFDAPADQPSADELAAAGTFRAILDTVTVMDLEKLRADQDDRLFRTRSLFVNWTEGKIRSVLIPEQWMRVVRDGKDVGYSYIVEEGETRGNTPGVKIGIRSRTVPKLGQQIDGETWYHVSFDRKIENWSSIALFTGFGEKYHATEFGSSEQRRKPIPAGAAQGMIGNPGVKLVDVYSLSVDRVTKKVTAPQITRELPPFYLPQALGHLLPRLMPLGEPHGYLFASYQSGDAEVKLRYIDVGVPGPFTIGGQKITAVPITDRLGSDVAVTTHYVDVSGKYYGSVTSFTDDDGVSSTIDSLPTDAATLSGIWSNASLTRPDEDPKVPLQ